MVSQFLFLFKAMRPRQWLKNVVVFASLVFTGELFNDTLFLDSFYAFLAFCFISSASYLLNDLLDIEKDKLHPFKKHRPIAAGQLNKGFVIGAMVVLVVMAFAIAKFLPLAFGLIIAAYLLLQFAYSFYLKHYPIIDILTIASGFMLRIYGGEFATGLHINVWLMLSVLSLSLFLAVGKRRSELTLLSNWEGSTPAKTRTVLGHYSEHLLNIYTAIFAASSWLFYATYAFLAPATFPRPFISRFLAEYIFPVEREYKWLMTTLPVVIYGVMRYTQLVYEKQEGESPERVLLSDKPLLTSILIWGTMVVVIIYGIGR